LHWDPARVAVRQDEVAVPGKFLAYTNACPRPRLLGEPDFLPLANAGYLRHLRFQLLIPFPKLVYFAQVIFNPAIQVFLLRLLRAELSFQFRLHSLDIERFPLVGDSCSGLKFFESNAKCLKLIPVTLFDLGGSLRQFSLEPEPDTLLVFFLPLLEQPKGFLRTKLGNSREVFHPEAIQHLSSLQLAFA
jgi:hypothetical protein